MGKTIFKIAANTGIIMSGQFIVGLISMFTSVVFVRYLGAGSFGVYSFVFAYLTFFTIIVDLGTSAILTREISRSPEKAGKLLGNAIIMRLVLSVLALVSSAAVLSSLRYPASTKILVLAGSLYFLFSVQNIFRLVFQANLRMEYSVAVDIIVAVIRCGLFLGLIAAKAALFWFVMAEVCVNIPSLILLYVTSRRFVVPRFNLDMAVWRYIARESWPLALSSVFVMIYCRIGQLMLFQMNGPQDVGYYAVAVKLSEVFNIIPVAFMVSVFPLFSRYFMSSAQTLAQAYRLTAQFLMALIIPIAAGGTMLAGPIISLLYKDAFLPATPAFIVLLWSEVFIFAGVLNNRLLVSVNRQRIDFAYTASAAVVSITLNLILIPRYGILGAAYATLAAYATGPVMNCVLKNIRAYGLVMFQQMIKPFLASLVMMACLSCLGHVPLAVAIIAGALVYGVTMVLIRGIRLDQVREIFQT